MKLASFYLWMRWPIAALLTINSLAANAEKWVDVPTDPGEHLYQYDMESIRKSVPNQVAVTWRERMVNSSYFIWTGVVDCQAISLSIDKAEIADSKVTQNIDTLSTYMDNSSLTRTRFPTLSNPEGRMLHTLCKQINVTQDVLMKTLADNMRKVWRCSTSKLAAPSIWCQAEPNMTQAIAMSIFRQQQIRKACNISDTELTMLFNTVLLERNTKLVKCNHQLTCSVSEMNQFNSDLGQDLGSAMAGKPCEKLSSRLRLYHEQKNRDEALARFDSCVNTAIIRMDDHVSSADVIASGVYGACHQALATGEDNSMSVNRQLESTVMPTIIAKILRQRAKNRPSKPLKKTIPTS